jgi:hypothetical protein
VKKFLIFLGLLGLVIGIYLAMKSRQESLEFD